MMDRVKNCVCYHVKHLYWRDDFYHLFSHIKKNQERVDWSTPWHVKSNQNNPVMFPVNVLSIYILYTLSIFLGICDYFLVDTSITGTKMLLLR